ncbi:putative Maleylacetoacetate isomerase [Hypsibius exemplaris]|uniref:maleylacetoacetate isomerase n=1 Tax=Hypsibius exemplaris TaxID=2072580 RepID=A0A1W0X618_HYPEX|nr:putative Maleylacetoacetate isomerase [Hypsibius exemplaris]
MYVDSDIIKNLQVKYGPMKQLKVLLHLLGGEKEVARAKLVDEGVGVDRMFHGYVGDVFQLAEPIHPRVWKAIVPQKMAGACKEDMVVLHGTGYSSCSWRVRIALALKGIPFKNVPVNLKTLSQKNEEFLRINPMGQVPALCIDGLVLTQSVAILEYLEESRPAHPLLPAGLRERALVRRIVETIASGIQPHQNFAGGTVPPGIPEKYKVAWEWEWGKMWIEKGFQGLEQMVKESSGKYCVGDAITLADVCLVPQVYNAKVAKVDMTAYPTLVKVNDALLELDAFRDTHPSLY